MKRPVCGLVCPGLSNVVDFLKNQIGGLTGNWPAGQALNIGAIVVVRLMKATHRDTHRDTSEI